MKVKLILLFIFFYLIALLLTLPAATVANFAPQNTNISLVATSGSIWQGKAEQLTIQNRYHLQDVKWRFDWVALAKLQLKVGLEFHNNNGTFGEGLVGWGLSGFFVQDLVVDLSAAELLSYISLPVPLDVSGSVSLVVNQVSQGTPYCEQIDGYLVWRNANIMSNMGDVDLQSVNVNLSCIEGQINADLTQTSDQINSSINLLLSQDSAYRLQGLIKDSQTLAPAIKDALSWLGAKNSEGATVLNFKGKL